jgi:MoxR-like ATPase
VPQVADLESVADMISVTPQVPIASHLIRYVSLLVEATHPEGTSPPPAVKRYVRWGASPRGGQAMVLAAKAAALIEGRPHVTAEDIRWAAVPALRHRLVLGYEATAEGIRPEVIIDEVIHSTDEPKSSIRGAP